MCKSSYIFSLPGEARLTNMKPYESYDWSSRQSLAATNTSSNSPAGGRKNVVGGRYNRVEPQKPVSNTGIWIM